MKTAALAAAAGIALAALAASPASAAPPADAVLVTPSYTCGSYEGLTLTQPSVEHSNVGLRAGEVVTARVAPSAAGEEFLLTVTMGLSFYFYSAPAGESISYQAPADGIYSLGWSVPTSATPSALTWTFDCSTAAAPALAIEPADDDKDGVANTADACAGTVLPDDMGRPVAGSYLADRAGSFMDGARRSAGITVADTGGCSAAQIAKALRLTGKNVKGGISLSVLTSWAASH